MKTAKRAAHATGTETKTAETRTKEEKVKAAAMPNLIYQGGAYASLRMI